jgi:hypothetical protein
MSFGMVSTHALYMGTYGHIAHVRTQERDLWQTLMCI